jgi:hypothetical protein
MRLSALVVLALLLPVAAMAQADAPSSEAALCAMACAVSASYALLESQPAPEGILDAGGCRLWQAPGVALAPGQIWLPGASARDVLLVDPQRLQGLLRDAHAFAWGEPPQPDEADYAAGRELPPQVYLLDSRAARARLGRYYSNYQQWRELCADESLPGVAQASLQADAAVVFSSPGGPLEFYFAYDAQGHLRLRHIVAYDYFSA